MATTTQYALHQSAWLCVAAAIVHLLIPLGGPEAYALLGAPKGLSQMAAAGSLRPLLSCIVIAVLLCGCAAYAFSALGWLPHLPLLRGVLGLIAFGLLLRGVLFPILALVAPHELSRVCGRCESLKSFVIATSLLCLLIAAGFLLAAMKSMESVRGERPALFHPSAHEP